MKKIFTLLLWASLLTAPFVTYADDGGEDIPPEKIPIGPGPIPNPEPGKLEPRSLSAISGWCTNDTIQLFFAHDMGTVFVTVVNTSLGSLWYCNAESSDGVVIIDFEPTPGNYTVTIETQTSGTYYGEFAL